MKENEKNFLLDVLYRNLNRSEVDFYDCLYKINTHSDVNALYQAMISLVRYKTYSKVFRDVLDILSFSVFNDNERFKSKSQLFCSLLIGLLFRSRTTLYIIILFTYLILRGDK